MNTGIQDGVSLAKVLAQTLRDGKTDRLDAWAHARHEVARDVVALADRLTRIATMKSRSGQALRNTAIGLIGRVPGIRASLAKKLAELDAWRCFLSAALSGASNGMRRPRREPTETDMWERAWQSALNDPKGKARRTGIAIHESLRESHCVLKILAIAFYEKRVASSVN